MPTYTYSGLHPRHGTIPVHTFFSCDDGKPVVAMKSSIVIDGQSLQKIQLKEASFMLNAFQHFHITNIYRTNQEYDYALLVENLENDSVPDKLVNCASVPDATYIGIIIDCNPQDGTYTVGCGPRVFTSVFSDFSCTDSSSEFASVHIQTCLSSISYGNICDYEADITCMVDCTSHNSSPSNSSSTMHDVGHCTPPTAVMPLEQNEASSIEVPEYRQNHLTTEYLSNCEPSAILACSLRDEPLMKDPECNFPPKYSSKPDFPTVENESPIQAGSSSSTSMSPEDFEACKPTIKYSSKPDLPTVENESPMQAGNSSCTSMSPQDFEAYKPTISTYEKRYKTLFDDEHTVTI